ncbi:radial spoke head protein 6 homolog A-like isoform X2 [Haliotis rubra]|uniref:radial spoke head protein 6 homolog A-like isoform X2 n=1 Tax=Haliotis rubra TaxID=36100 RepID=UPI001EE5FB8F|nr:radial spoke head protein 6 homolog A-like isoform X2 [Haliotis rubra]
MAGGSEKNVIKGMRDVPKRPSEDENEEESLPVLSEEDRNCMNAKMHLLTQSTDEGISLYDHLAVLLSGALEHQPENFLDNLEKLSLQLKRDKVKITQSTVRSIPPPSPSYHLAKVEQRQFQKISNEEMNRLHDFPEDGLQEDERYTAIPNLMKQAHCFQMAGVGLSMEEYTRIALSLRELVKVWPIETVRFWGKVLGLKQNYYVAEAEFPEGEYETDISDDEEEEDDDPAEEREDSLFDETTTILSMKPLFKHPRKIPCDAAGTGLNKKVYFVCSEPCQPWYRLPHVTPEQIVTARKLRKYFTGYPNQQMVTYPPFPGLEKNYLRAQIARISASTHVSPIGFFKFDEEGEEEEEGEPAEGRDGFVEDQDFEGLSMRDLTDQGMTNWVHHTPFVLPQGRITWYNPLQGHEGEEENEEEEERNEPDEPEPEHGPPLLTPLSEDAQVGKSPAWIAKASSQFVPEYSVAILHSNTWPGAYAFASDKARFFENVYIGWGHKHLESCFEPAIPEPPLPEFPTGPEVIEAEDPSPETEAAVRSAMREKELDAPEEEEEVGEMEAEEEEEGDEEDQ